MKNVSLLVISGLFFGVCTYSTIAFGRQDPSEQERPLNDKVTIKLPTTGPASIHVPDAGKALVQNGPRFSSKETIDRAARSIENSLCSKIIGDGVTTYDIVNNGKPFGISVYDDGRIDVAFIKTYNVSNFDELENEHFKIWRSVVDAFEQEESTVVRLDIETKIESIDETILKDRCPEAFMLYVRYHKQ